jgi:hypothetical protein
MLLRAILGILRTFYDCLIREEPTCKSIFQTFHDRFPDLDPSLHHLVLKDLFNRDDFSSILEFSARNLLLRVVLAQIITAKSSLGLIINSESSFDRDRFFENLIVTCRILPAHRQRELCQNLYSLYEHSVNMAELHQQKMQSFSVYWE